jgi:hypothetical protein
MAMRLMIVLLWLTSSIAASAQGISNARDGHGNLVERGATTRTYPSRPMANSAIASPQTDVIRTLPMTEAIPPGRYMGATAMRPGRTGLVRRPH